jgi:glycosyltransferase involved in cell wall biosynthesis
MLKIITVYKHRLTEKDASLGILNPIDMSNGRWIKISEALSRLGCKVDIAIPDTVVTENLNSNGYLKMIPLSKVNWNDYDIVKTEFHGGFDTLEKYGGTSHPFIISKLGSVVGSIEMEGIYFYGDVHKNLFDIQEKINKISKYITVLSKPALELWKTTHGRKKNFLLVPGGVDSVVPSPSNNPYPEEDKIKIIFAGNIYNVGLQGKANKVLVYKLNTLGRLLSSLGASLYMIGPGDVSDLDQNFINYLGIVPYKESWNYLHFADVGIVVSAGKFMHNNESTKIYHYLRAGLPVVSESGFPNDYVVRESKLGFVTDNGNMELMAQNIIKAAKTKWNRDFTKDYIIKNHTWDKRVKVYDKIFKENFPSKYLRYGEKITVK